MISAVRTSMYSPMFETAKTSTDPATPVTGPAEPTTPRTATPLSDSMGKDDFMKLLVAQLKNQDPLNPMDGKEMAAQLAQFSSVEQMMQLNTTVSAQSAAQDKMVKALDGLQTSQTEQGNNLASLIEGQMAVSTVGKIGVTNGNTVFVDRDGGGSITIDTGLTAGPERFRSRIQKVSLSQPALSPTSKPACRTLICATSRSIRQSRRAARTPTQ